MRNYVVGRIAQAVPVLLIVSFLVFLIVYLVPGDPATVILGPDASVERLEAIRRNLGLDRPFQERYVLWLGDAATGDLGVSAISRQPVLPMLARAFPVTIYLALFSLLIGVVIAVPTATLSALRRNSWLDLLFSSWAFFGLSVPSFWLGIMLIYIFSARLKWVPIQGYVSPFDDPVSSLQTMLLPSVTLGVFLSGPLMRYLRSSLLQVISQEYVVVARAKGLKEQVVVSRYMLRNALIPFVTVLGMQLGYLLGGAAVIEVVFALPGIGRLAVNAIQNRDFPVIQGIVLLVATSFILINIAVDLLYAVLDPRIRVGQGSV